MNSERAGPCLRIGVELVPPVVVRDNPVQMRVVELAHVLDTFRRRRGSWSRVHQWGDFGRKSMPGHEERLRMFSPPTSGTDPVFLHGRGRSSAFGAMAGIIAAILIASAVSDSLGDVRAWTLVAAVGIGYMISRGLAKSGTKYSGGEDPLRATVRRTRFRVCARGAPPRGHALFTHTQTRKEDQCQKSTIRLRSRFP